MEKRYFVSKHMFKFIDKDGNIMDDTDKILEETKLFYQNLYTEKNRPDTLLIDYVTLPKLEETEKQALEGYI